MLEANTAVSNACHNRGGAAQHISKNIVHVRLQPNLEFSKGSQTCAIVSISSLSHPTYMQSHLPKQDSFSSYVYGNAQNANKFSKRHTLLNLTGVSRKAVLGRYNICSGAQSLP